MKQSNVIRTVFIKAVCLIVGLSFFPDNSLQAQGLIDYTIEVRTKDVIRGGTDNTVWLRLIGEDGQTEAFKVKGDKERDHKKTWTVKLKNVGKITKLWINSDGSLADEWACKYVYVTRNKTTMQKNHEGGYYEFLVNEFVGYSRRKYNPVYAYWPPKSIFGKETHGETVTITNFGTNGTTLPAEVMKYTEYWSNIEASSMTTSSVSSISRSLTVGYSGDPMTAGFSGSVAASWTNTLTRERTKSQTKISSSSFDWTYTIPAQRSVLRKITFNVPYEYELFEDMNGGTYAIRTVGAMIVPAGQETKQIPSYEEDGTTIKPVLWSEIENDFLAFADATTRNSVISKKSIWMANGWVVLTAPVASNPTSLEGGTGTYTIQQKSNNRYLDAHLDNSNDYSTVTRTAQNNDSQEWIITPLGNDTYTIQQKNNNRYLDATYANDKYDYSAVTRPAQNNDTQKWIIISLGNDTYTIQHKINNQYLDAWEDNSHDYSVVTRPIQNNDTQKWIIR